MQMPRDAQATLIVEAEVRAPAADAQLVRVATPQTDGLVMRDREDFWLDLCLGPQPRRAGACYRDHWAPQRYEPFGRLILLPPGETIQVRVEADAVLSTLRCHLQPQFLQEWLDDGIEWTDAQLAAGLDIVEPNLDRLLLRLADEVRRPRFASGMLVELMFGELAIELARYFRQPPAPAPAKGLAPWRLRIIDERLREIGELPTLGELASLCQLSVRQLTRAFRVSRGCALGAYVINSRIDKAKQSLAGGQSVKAIAYTLGFSSPSAFCYAFRRATGQTPLQFRGTNRP